MVSKYNWNSPSWRIRWGKAKLTDDIVLRNDVHGTTHKIRGKFFRRLTAGQIDGCRKKLCPDGCCPGPLGVSGPQDVNLVYGFDVQGNELVTPEPFRKVL